MTTRVTKRKSDSPITFTQVLLQLLALFVSIKSIQVGLSEFLYHASCLKGLKIVAF